MQTCEVLSSEGGIRTLDTAGMNRVLWPTELLRHIVETSFPHLRKFPSDGTYRARTYDPLLVRQMLSQLS